MLDWTERPLVAPYFAAIDVAKRHHGGGAIPNDRRFAVWALSRPFIEMFGHRLKPWGIVTVTVPKHSNPNLSAQSGLFTLVRFRQGLGFDKTVDFDPRAPAPTIDELFKQEDLRRLAWDTDGVPKVPMLYKFTCPQSDAPALLHYLHLHRIDAASIYHGHDSVRAAMQEAGYRSVISRQDRIGWGSVKRCPCCDD